MAIEVLVGRIQRGQVAAHHPSPLVNQPEQFVADAPVPFVLAFLAQLLRRAAFSNRKDDFHRVRISYRQDARLSQEAFTSLNMRFQPTLQPCPVWQAPE